ncbi:hypothetical protein TUM19329_04050 [Legionella antarctica]|uniref:Uncharacterized protein n=1 Tax=Legionella antarctica TaxID=2708020 RepID=A0A6F8T040_9GAMM|nr:hypothetical protein [Legionella antarctica]BCA94044.1 hypothetical protein TUM19329_04050 [Legionella antarctica]
MLDDIIKDLALQNCFTEIDKAEWHKLSHAFAKEPDELKRTVFIRALSAHSGVPIVQVQAAFASLNNNFLSRAEQEQIHTRLQKAQGTTTLKINDFQQHQIFKNMDLDSLSISRAQWNTLITRFEQQHRAHVTQSFFLSTLSAIKKTSVDNLNAALSREQPARKSKRKHPEDKEISSKRVFHPYREDFGVNPLIFQSLTKNLDLEDKLEATGVRVVPPLSPATPERGYPIVKQTPGGTKVRPVFTTARCTLFTHLTPIKCRVNIQDVSQEQIAENLPRLRIGRAEPVKYIANLESILERSGMVRRQTQRAVAGASAADVFRAHGIAIIPAHSRFKHWAHLIAHFLAEPQDILTKDPEQEVINLIPSTAEANYNTLEAIELFIKDKLMDEITDQIHIHVQPIYSEERLIPDSLVYTLDWIECDLNGEYEKHNEVFFINPQSHFRLTKSMHQSIALLREAGDIASSTEMDADEHNANNLMRIKP